MKKLYRSRTNVIISGILGGVGEYSNVDPVVVRIIFLVAFFVTGIIPMTFLYILMHIVVPQTPDVVIVSDESTEK